MYRPRRCRGWGAHWNFYKEAHSWKKFSCPPGAWKRARCGPLLNSFLLVFDGHLESLFQQGELTNEICDGIGEGLLGPVVPLQADDDLVFQGGGKGVLCSQQTAPVGP